MNLQAWNRRRLFNAVRVGDIERVQEILAAGMDPNLRDRRGQPVIVKAARAMIPESGVVDALLEAGADPNATDDNGLTALDHARRRLARLGPMREGLRAWTVTGPLRSRLCSVAQA